MTDYYYWRNVDRKPCEACGEVHEFVSRNCVPILFEEEFICHERRLAPAEFPKAIQQRRAWQEYAEQSLKEATDPAA